MIHREVLRVISSKITGNVYYSIFFASSKSSRRATKLHEKGHFARVFEK